MSFQIFKNNMLSYMQNQDGIATYGDFANKLTTEYDMAIRRGFQTVNNIPVLKTNTELMLTLVNIALLTALQKREGTHTIVNDLGKGVVGYWIGATLNLSPPPVIPATGAVLNISTTAALVSNPGAFPEINPQIPTNDSAIFLDQLILGIQIHLLSIEGIYNTVSLYPGFPVVPPAPGILLWKGYTVPNSRRTSPRISPTPISQTPTTSVDVLLNSIPDDNNTVAGATRVVQQTGREILTDEDLPTSLQLERVKSLLPNDVPPPISQPVEVVATPTEVVKANPRCGIGLDYTANISPNYLLRNLSLDATFPHKIRAQHGLSTDDIVCNLENVALNLLEPIRSKFPSLIINSAFRGTPSLSAGRISQHETGEAIDIQFPGISPQQYLPIAKWIVENTVFDQLIFEHGNSIWLHISTKRVGINRKSTLTMFQGSYERGIKCYYNT